MRKIQGQTVSEDQVDQWVAEAESGYDVEQLRKVGRPSRAAGAANVFTVRLTEDEVAQLGKRARRENLNRSEAIRQAVHDWANA